MPRTRFWVDDAEPFGITCGDIADVITGEQFRLPRNSVVTHEGIVALTDDRVKKVERLTRTALRRHSTVV